MGLDGFINLTYMTNIKSLQRKMRTQGWGGRFRRRHLWTKLSHFWGPGEQENKLTVRKIPREVVPRALPRVWVRIQLGKRLIIQAFGRLADCLSPLKGSQCPFNPCGLWFWSQLWCKLFIFFIVVCVTEFLIFDSIDNIFWLFWGSQKSSQCSSFS